MPEPSHEASHRIFIGIPLDAACQHQVDEVLADLRQDQDIRWVPSINRHLTLAFLGELPASVLHELQRHFPHAFPDAYAFAFPLERLARFPDSHGHIIAAVNAPSEAIRHLHEQTLALVQQCGLLVEGRPYRPHVTLGRIRHPARFSSEPDTPLALSLAVDRVCLYESIGTEQGRLYKVLAEQVLLPL